MFLPWNILVALNRNFLELISIIRYPYWADNSEIKQEAPLFQPRFEVHFGPMIVSRKEEALFFSVSEFGPRDEVKKMSVPRTRKNKRRVAFPRAFNEIISDFLSSLLLFAFYFLLYRVYQGIRMILVKRSDMFIFLSFWSLLKWAIIFEAAFPLLKIG